MDVRSIDASEFEAKCLQLIDEVNDTGEPLIITRNGEPIALLRPAKPKTRSIFCLHAGLIEIHGDITGPVLEEFEAPR